MKEKSTESSKRCSFILLEHCSAERLEEVGGKANGLHNLINSGANVPPGFCIPVSSFQSCLKWNNAMSKLLRLLPKNNEADPTKILESSRQIEQLILSLRIPTTETQEIIQAYDALPKSQQLGVAVRSSGVLEDMSSLSFAGQHDTFLNVGTNDELLEAITRVWASYYSDRALSYRMKANLDHDPKIAVIVQSMVNATKSGVLFTLDPLTGDRSKIVIEAIWSLGEGLVRGEVTPDHYMIDKVTREVEKAVVSDKTYEYVIPPGSKGILKREVPSERAKARCLSDHELVELAKHATEIERHFGSPQDIEWAAEELRETKIFFLQSRSITTVGKSFRKTNGETDDIFSLVASSVGKTRQINL